MTYWVYIMSNSFRNVLYVGVTNNLPLRVREHKNLIKEDSFTSRYNCTDLIYYEEFSDINLAINREKQIKGWKRDKKENLIKSVNPELETLLSL